MWGPGKTRKVMATYSCRRNKERKRIGRSGGDTGTLPRSAATLSVGVYTFPSSTSSVPPLASPVPLPGIIDSTLDVIGAASSIIDSTLDVIGAASSIIDSTLDIIITAFSIIDSTLDVIVASYFPALCVVVLGRPDLPRLAIPNTLVRVVPLRLHSLDSLVSHPDRLTRFSLGCWNLLLPTALRTLTEFCQYFPLSLDALIADTSQLCPLGSLVPYDSRVFSLDSLGVAEFTRCLWILSLLTRMRSLGSHSVSCFSRHLWVLSAPPVSLCTSGFSRSRWILSAPLDSLGASGFSGCFWILLVSQDSLGVSGFSWCLRIL
jgi:hypothetical protein